MEPSQTALMVRQPIFDQKLRIVAYQLRYQRSSDLSDTLLSHDQEGSLLLLQTFTSLSQDGKKTSVPLFIPFPEVLLEHDQPLTLPTKEVVIEIASDVLVTDKLLEHLKLLRKNGYRLAISEFAMQPHLIKLIKFVHIVKIDIRALPTRSLPKLIVTLKKAGKTPLAQHVDDFKALNISKALKFPLLQGNFISRPSHSEADDKIPPSSAALLQLVQELERPDILPEEIEELIMMDPVLTFKILKVVNSAAYQLAQPIESLQQAVVLLGQDQIRKWAILISLAGQKDKPEELSRNLLVRARMCELLASSAELANASAAFMTGMISQLDLLLGVSLNTLLDQLPLDDTIKAAIHSYEGELGEILAAVMDFEKGEWTRVESSTLDRHFFDVAYRHSLSWAENAMLALSESE